MEQGNLELCNEQKLGKNSDGWYWLPTLSEALGHSGLRVRVHKSVLLAVNDSLGPSYAFDVQLLRFPWGMQNSCDTPEKVPHTCSRDEDVVIPVLRARQCLSCSPPVGLHLAPF